MLYIYNYIIYITETYYIQRVEQNCTFSISETSYMSESEAYIVRTIAHVTECMSRKSYQLTHVVNLFKTSNLS